MRVVQAYRFALDPTPAQARTLAAQCGAARVAFNWGLAVVKANLGQRAAERSYGIDDERLTPALSWSMYALRKVWNQVKDTVAPWWRECSKEAFARGLERLAAASHESTRKLARHIEHGTATIASATVRMEAGRWFVSFTVRIDRPERTPHGRTRWWGWISASPRWPCSPTTALRSPTLAIWRARPESCGACPARSPAAQAPTRGPGNNRPAAGCAPTPPATGRITGTVTRCPANTTPHRTPAVTHVGRDSRPQ